jgi:hypothetical protein
MKILIVDDQQIIESLTALLRKEIKVPVRVLTAETLEPPQLILQDTSALSDGYGRVFSTLGEERKYENGKGDRRGRGRGATSLRHPGRR